MVEGISIHESPSITIQEQTGEELKLVIVPAYFIAGWELSGTICVIDVVHGPIARKNYKRKNELYCRQYYIR
jgi:hypothetical protein